MAGQSRSNETTQRAASRARGATPASELAVGWVTDSALAGIDVLRGARVRIGRGDDCHLRLEHASVSRHHAELYRQGPIYALRDLGSTNGTRLNGDPVEHTAVSAGDVLRFGDCLGVVFRLDSCADPVQWANLAPGFWGGPGLAAELSTLRASASSDVPVVVVGETGTGKERVANAVHHWSGRSGAFWAVNCSAVPAALAEAELFGHERGAFTGAERARAGHFQAAHGGTLFLDELGDLPLGVQAKLLRAVEQREVLPLGSSSATSVDVRIVAAAQEPLDVLVERGKLRVDLAARLGGFVARLRPLRERREDIPGLVLSLLAKHARGQAPLVAPGLLEWLCLRDWPGNVRELELFVRKLLALYPSEASLALSFAYELAGRATAVPAAPSGERPAVPFRDRRESDQHRLTQALEVTKGNLKAAAASIGISRSRAYRLLNGSRKGRDAEHD